MKKIILGSMAMVIALSASADELIKIEKVQICDKTVLLPTVEKPDGSVCVSYVEQSKVTSSEETNAKTCKYKTNEYCGAKVERASGLLGSSEVYPEGLKSKKFERIGSAGKHLIEVTEHHEHTVKKTTTVTPAPKTPDELADDIVAYCVGSARTQSKLGGGTFVPEFNRCISVAQKLLSEQAQAK